MSAVRTKATRKPEVQSGRAPNRRSTGQPASVTVSGRKLSEPIGDRIEVLACRRAQLWRTGHYDRKDVEELTAALVAAFSAKRAGL